MPLDFDWVGGEMTSMNLLAMSIMDFLENGAHDTHSSGPHGAPLLGSDRGDVQGWNGHALDDDVDIAGYRDGTCIPHELRAEATRPSLEPEHKGRDDKGVRNAVRGKVASEGEGSHQKGKSKGQDKQRPTRSQTA